MLTDSQTASVQGVAQDQATLYCCFTAKVLFMAAFGVLGIFSWALPKSSQEWAVELLVSDYATSRKAYNALKQWAETNPSKQDRIVVAKTIVDGLKPLGRGSGIVPLPISTCLRSYFILGTLQVTHLLQEGRSPTTPALWETWVGGELVTVVPTLPGQWFLQVCWRRTTYALGLRGNQAGWTNEEIEVHNWLDAMGSLDAAERQQALITLPDRAAKWIKLPDRTQAEGVSQLDFITLYLEFLIRWGLNEQTSWTVEDQISAVRTFSTLEKIKSPKQQYYKKVLESFHRFLQQSPTTPKGVEAVRWHTLREEVEKAIKP